MIKKHTAIILLIFSAIAIIDLVFFLKSLNAFFSWLLVGLWIVFTIKVIQKRKEYKEYNSPKNTSFFLLCPLGVGLFFNFWGYFTGLGGDNLLEDFVPFLYVSPWTIIFALPYILYGIFTLRACYKKFDIVYIIRTRSINARKFVIFYTILILIGILSYIIYFNVILNYFFIVIERAYFYELDIILLSFSIFLIYLFVRHAIFGSARVVPEVSQDYIARRRRRLESVTFTPVRSTPRPATTKSSSRTTTQRSTTTTTSRITARKPSTTSITRAIVRRPRSAVSASFEKLKPKAGILSLEDFKCIFCFQLPQLSDQRRGIVLCPNCRHPSHADEFKDWTKASPLCSRCDASIPPSFRRNPKIISVREYMEVINEFKKRKR
ncbi:MAG: hypothetical protein ACFE8A_02845 [Candidatus Hodarchaeota archaeon]